MVTARSFPMIGLDQFEDRYICHNSKAIISKACRMSNAYPVAWNGPSDEAGDRIYPGIYTTWWEYLLSQSLVIPLMLKGYSEIIAVTKPSIFIKSEILCILVMVLDV